MTRAKRSRDRGSSASSTPRWRWWPPSASAGTGGCCRAFATRAMGAWTFIDWSVCCVSALVGLPLEARYARRPPRARPEHARSGSAPRCLRSRPHACAASRGEARLPSGAYSHRGDGTHQAGPTGHNPRSIRRHRTRRDEYGHRRAGREPIRCNTHRHDDRDRCGGRGQLQRLAHRPPGERVHAPCHGTGARGRDERRVSNRPNHRSAERGRPHLGGDHTCGVTPSGTAYCWGWNQDGQLGDGTRVDRRTPVPVAAPAGVGFAAVSLGGWHTCGVTLGGTAYCWGHNAYGQLGDGTDTSRTIPVAVSVPAGLSFAAVSAGFYHTCGLATTRAAYCWAVATADSAARAPTPVATPEGVSFVAVSTGGVHACGLTAAGSAYCWGDNNYGKLGDGTTTSSATPVLVPAPVGATFAQLSAGGEHTCGRTDAGAVYCWGQNGSGQLGDGTIPFNRTTPTAVAAPQGVVFAHVSAGWNHTCAMTAAGAGYCWGSNVGGELGDGTFVTSPVPVQIVQ